MPGINPDQNFTKRVESQGPLSRKNIGKKYKPKKKKNASLVVSFSGKGYKLML